MPRNRVHWTWFLYIEIESNGLNFYVQKLSSMNLVFVHINQVQWTRFLYIEIESIGLAFFSTTCPADHSNFQNVSLKKLTVLSLKKLTVSLIPSHSQSLSHSHSIPSCSVSLSFPRAPVFHSHSLSLRHCPSLSLLFPFLQLHRYHPSTPSPSPLRSVAIAVPTTAGYHSHLISSMWFLGFISLYE